MWSCRCGFKNGNSNMKCHGENCKHERPLEVEMIKQKRFSRLRKNKEAVSKQMGEERMMRKFKKMVGGNI